MTPPVLHQVNQHIFWLSPERTVYWENERTLIVSDLHFGKTGHFRKSGIAVPQSVFRNDLQRFVDQIAYFKPQQVIAVGDLFHSKANKELELFLKWRNDFSLLHLLLVKGNHDILKNDWYEQAGITVHEHHYLLNNICFIHDPAERDCEAGFDYTFAGHFHPGIHFKGMARQNLTLPCFYFSSSFAILPAFSKFSGLAMVEKKKEDDVFVLVDGKVIKV